MLIRLLEGLAVMGVTLFIMWVIGYFISRTRCPRCRKLTKDIDYDYYWDNNHDRIKRCRNCDYKEIIDTGD